MTKMDKPEKPQILLTPELKAKVEAKMRECYAIAEKKYGVTFEFPEVRYDIKSWTGGLAYHGRNLIRYNLILLVENEEHYIANVVPHEVAHLINRKVNKVPPGKKRLMPHGKEWKAVMDLLMTKPAVCHTYDCSSIEKFPKRKRGAKADDRVTRILKQISRLTDEERATLENQLEYMG